MLFEFRESSVSIIVENSVALEAFLPTIKEILINVLHQKASINGDSFKFNVGHFSREVSFWADQVAECTLENASSAAQWIRDWTSQNFLTTPRGTVRSSRTGPHTLPALLTALSDPFANAVYLVSGSTPFEGTSDLLNHIKFSHKGRPIHVIYTTIQQNVDYKAMEILHLISKETNGQFRVGYFDAVGNLIQVLHQTPPKPTSTILMNHQPLTMMIPQQNAAMSPLYLSPVSNQMVSVPTSNFTTHHQPIVNGMQHPPTTFNADDLTNLYESFRADLLSSSKKASHFNDLKISSSSPLEKSGHGHFLTSSHHQSNGHSIGDNLLKHLSDNHSSDELPPHYLRVKQKLESEYGNIESISGPQMEEIKKLFKDFYLNKHSHNHHENGKESPHHFKALESKEYKFNDKGLKKIRVKSTRSRSSDSSSSSSSSNSDSSSSTGGKKSGRKSSRKKGSSRKHKDKIGHRHHQHPQHDTSHHGHHGVHVTPVTKTLHTAKRALTCARRYSFSNQTRPGSATSMRSSSSAHNVHSVKPKPAWHPAVVHSDFLTSGRKASTTQHMNNTTTDRSAWMNPWMNEWTKRMEPKPVHNNGIRNVHNNGARNFYHSKKSTETSTRLHRPTSAPLNLNTYTQTGTDQKNQDMQIETIRDLVKQNSLLLKNLEVEKPSDHKSHLSHYSHADHDRIQQNRNKIFARIHGTRAKPEIHHHNSKHVSEAIKAKQHLNDEIKQLAGVRISNNKPLTDDERRLQTIRDQRKRWENMRQSRDQHVVNSLQRREEIRRQQQQALYKNLYHNIVSDVKNNDQIAMTERDVEELHHHASTINNNHHAHGHGGIAFTVPTRDHGSTHHFGIDTSRVIAHYDEHH